MKRHDDILRIANLAGLESSIVEPVVHLVCDDILFMLLGGDQIRFDGLGVFGTKDLPFMRRKVREKNGVWVMRNFPATTLIKFKPSAKISGV